MSNDPNNNSVFDIYRHSQMKSDSNNNEKISSKMSHLHIGTSPDIGGTESRMTESPIYSSGYTPAVMEQANAQNMNHSNGNPYNNLPWTESTSPGINTPHGMNTSPHGMIASANGMNPFANGINTSVNVMNASAHAVNTSNHGMNATRMNTPQFENTFSHHGIFSSQHSHNNCEYPQRFNSSPSFMPSPHNGHSSQNVPHQSVQYNHLSPHQNHTSMRSSISMGPHSSDPPQNSVGHHVVDVSKPQLHDMDSPQVGLEHRNPRNMSGSSPMNNALDVYNIPPIENQPGYHGQASGQYPPNGCPPGYPQVAASMNYQNIQPGPSSFGSQMMHQTSMESEYLSTCISFFNLTLVFLIIVFIILHL